MAIGALGAILFFRKNRSFLKIAFHPLTQIICWLSVGLLAFSLFLLPSLIRHEIVAVIAVGLIVNVAGNAKTLIRLTGKIPDYLGKISFGLYVYHPLLIYILGSLLGRQVGVLPETWKLILLYSVIPLITIIVAAVSYEFFEKRFLKLKSAYSRVVSQPAER